MNRADLLYSVLKDGHEYSRREIQQRVGFFLTNNAASELRKRGFNVVHSKKGRVDSYRLLRTPAVRDERPEVTAGVRSKVTVSPTSQGEPGSTGPDAHQPGSPAPPEQLTIECGGGATPGEFVAARHATGTALGDRSPFVGRSGPTTPAEPAGVKESGRVRTRPISFRDEEAA